MQVLQFKDNSKIDISPCPTLGYIANRPLKSLLDANKRNLLVWPNSFEECDDDADDLPIFTMYEKEWADNHCTKVRVETGNLAGFIGVGNLQIDIASRFTQDTEEDFFLHFLLKEVFSVNLFNLKHASSDDAVFDFMLCLFPKLLNEALSQGLYKEYQTYNYNDVNVKGKIDINRYLRQNIPFNGKISYSTRELSFDNPITQLVRHTIEYILLRKLGRTILMQHPQTSSNVKQIIAATPTYSLHERQTVIKENTKVVRHPYFLKYVPLQKLCLQILRHDGLKYGPKNDEIYGVLFDVSWLWEEYLAGILKPLDFKHPQNHKGLGKIYLDKNNVFYRYPDYYSENRRIVADAKYKWEIDSRNDVNQIITYMYYFKSHKGIFILPASSSIPEKKFFLNGYGLDDSASIRVLRYPIPQNQPDFKTFYEGMQAGKKELINFFV